LNIIKGSQHFKKRRLAAKLSSAGERSINRGHPWIFSDSIVKISSGGSPGDLVIVYSFKRNSVIGIGLYDPNSPIRIKMLHHGGAVSIDSKFFENRIKTAYSKRLPLISENTNGYRLIHGENDRLPGMIADVYDTVLVLKLYSEIWVPYLSVLTDLLIEVTGSEAVVLRMSRKLQKLTDSTHFDGEVVYGVLEKEEVAFREHGVHFSANVVQGHKTGFFLDHRHNRKILGELSEGMKVLDVFSYSGGFSVHALVNGAKEVVGVDVSAKALETAKLNACMNTFTGKYRTIVGDAFNVLKELIASGQTFDLVVIDPPSFAKSKNEVELALLKYKSLAQLGSQLTRPGGLLILASCSSRVKVEQFFEANEIALSGMKRKFELINRTQHDIDHPISFEEGSYLKTGYYRFSK
jgi:23S rRNA (cytosine1962-C5)-methyltransferase